MTRSTAFFAVPLLLVVAGCGSEGAADLGGDSHEIRSRSPIVIEGADMNFAADIFAALEIPAITTSAGIETKAIGGLSCERSMVDDREMHRCTVSADVTSQQGEQIWNALALPTVHAFERRLKAHGPFVLVDTDDSGFVIAENTGCANVVEGDLASAEKCMAFWSDLVPQADQLLMGNVFGVSNDPAVKQKALELIKSQGGTVDEGRLADRSLFFAAVLSSDNEEGPLQYYDFLPGRYPELGVVYSIHPDDIVSPGEEDRQTFTTEELEAWSLGFQNVNYNLGYRL